MFLNLPPTSSYQAGTLMPILTDTPNVRARSINIFCLFFVCTLFLNFAFGADKSKKLFGWELEFTNSRISNSEFGDAHAQANDVNDAYREKWRQIIKEVCKKRKDCRIKKLRDWISWYTNDGDVVWSWEVVSYRIIYDDGFWFQLSYDPGVVEVQMKPSTAKEFARIEKRLERDLFATAKKAGLKPNDRETHLHTGAKSAFKLDLKHIRNFLVDGVNHPEWNFLFAANLFNAPPLVVLPSKKFEAFAKIIGDVDSGKITDLDTFVKKIRRYVYDVTYEQSFVESGYDLPQKFQEWNLERLRNDYDDKEKTIEHRAVPQPKNARDLVDLTDLVNARVEFILNQDRKPIPLLPRKEKLSRKEQVRRFQTYVEEAGLNINTYTRFLGRSCQRYLTDAEL